MAYRGGYSGSGSNDARAIVKSLQSERTKTFAVGASGAFVGIGAGEYIGRTVGAMVAPSSTHNQYGVSLAVKVVLGVATLFLNTMTGLPGLFTLGLGWGFVGSAVTDVFNLAGKGGLVGAAYATAKQLNANKRSIQSAADVYVESAEAQQGRQQGQLVTVSE